MFVEILVSVEANEFFEKYKFEGGFPMDDKELNIGIFFVK